MSDKFKMELGRCCYACAFSFYDEENDLICEKHTGDKPHFFKVEIFEVCNGFIEN